jgi:predicted nucleic acid-binding protein
MYIVETEFLFGLRTVDKWHKQVSKILELRKKGKIKSLYSCASAFIEAGIVLQAHGFHAEQIEDVIFLMKQKLVEAEVEEVELDSDDVIRLYELLQRYDIEYFEAMQAAVALGRNAILITNDKIFKSLGIQTISFKELVETTTNARK